MRFGPLIVAYYDATRPRITGEISFWSSLVKRGSDVLEIGSGTGYLSKHLARKRPRSLTLVESSSAMRKYLRGEMAQLRKFCRVRLVGAAFESRRYPKQDAILFAYDSLSLLSAGRDRAKLYRVARETLRPEGRFVVHFTNRREATAVLENYARWKVGEVETRLGRLSFRKMARPVGRNHFGFDFHLVSKHPRKQEKYRLRIAILDAAAEVRRASREGLRLLAHYHTYGKGRLKKTREEFLVFGLKK